MSFTAARALQSHIFVKTQRESEHHDKGDLHTAQRYEKTSIIHKKC